LLIVDTNVLIDVLEDDPEWADWSLQRLRELARIHELAINPVIYGELSVAFESIEDLESVVSELQLRLLEIPRPALFLAGKAFMRYRREGGTKTSVLADFFIGAHAAVADCQVLTRDARRYRYHFPTVELIVPDQAPCCG
jgi:predicted nucleic acid-binding protein